MAPKQKEEGLIKTGKVLKIKAEWQAALSLLS